MAEGGTGEPPKFSLVTSADPLRHKLWQARQEGFFSDFQIEVNGIRIPCHKLIVSTQSAYFSCMLQHENTEEVIQGFVNLKLLGADAVKLVVDFMYSGEIDFEFHMVQDVIKVMNRFQLTETILQEKVSEYIIHHLCPDNCLGWFQFGEQMNLEKIKAKAETIMLQRISDVSKGSEFVSLSFSELTDYMQKAIQSHYNHDQGLKAFVRWAMHDASERSQTFEEILQVVSLNKCSTGVLRDIYETHGKVLLNNFDLLHQFTSATLSCSVPEPTLDIIVTGGCLEKNMYSRKTWLFNLESGSTIEKASQMKDAVFTATCASPDGLISVGGSPTGRTKDTSAGCFLYHKNTDTWVELPCLPAPTFCAGATCVQDVLLMVVGGFNDRQKQTICLDLRTKRSWTIHHDMPQGMAFPIVGSIDECVFVIYSTCTDNEKARVGNEISVQCYDTTTHTWTFKNPLPESIKKTHGARAVTLGGQLYLVGGASPICARYDHTCDTWTILAPPHYSHMYGAALALNGKILLSGGRGDEEVQDNIEEYDPSTNTWRLLLVKLPVPLYHQAMILGST